MDALQLLKDTILGMEASYSDFCYAKDIPGWQLDEDKIQVFIGELLVHAQSHPCCTQELEGLIRDFLYIVIQYMDITFTHIEYKFSSIRKIAAVVRKENINNTSPFDILITDEKERLSPTCLSLYARFTRNIVAVNQDDFFICVKYALETFINNHQLNCLSNELVVKQTSRRIKRLADLVRLDNKHFISLNMEAHNEPAD